MRLAVANGKTTWCYCVFLPKVRGEMTWGNNCVFSPGELVGALVCHPEYKLLSVSTIPQMPTSSIAYSAFSWPGLLKHLRQMLISNSRMEEGEFGHRSLRPIVAPNENWSVVDPRQASTGRWVRPLELRGAGVWQEAASTPRWPTSSSWEGRTSTAQRRVSGRN